MRMRMDGGARCGIAALVGVVATGCVYTRATTFRELRGGLVRPDRVIVHQFAVTPHEVAIDRGLHHTGGSLGRVARQSAEEVWAGQQVSRALVRHLVDALRTRGIDATRAGPWARPTETTLTLRGDFVQVDGRTLPHATAVGFGLEGAEIRTHVRLYQGDDSDQRLVAEADTIVPSDLEHGMAPTAVRPATTVLPVAATDRSAAAPLTREAYFPIVEADAERAAAEIAARMAHLFERRGWIRTEAR